ncbi:hypothetical protein GCM10027612_33250 [Microbispora bryophytorum subsp. camponoti]
MTDEIDLVARERPDAAPYSLAAKAAARRRLTGPAKRPARPRPRPYLLLAGGTALLAAAGAAAVTTVLTGPRTPAGPQTRPVTVSAGSCGCRRCRTCRPRRCSARRPAR